ncbi:MAG: acyl-CoA thioester hydrolase/BAAT C-terminal domain-containing protein [Pseudomonadota bacterium]
MSILIGSASNASSKTLISHFYQALNLTNTKAPVLFLFTGSGGGSWPREPAELSSLLNNGYHVVTIVYFGLPGIPSNLSRIEIDPIIETIKKYKNHKNIISNCIAVVGGSKGGELVLLLGSISKDINLVASITPSHYLALNFLFFEYN